MGVISLNCPHSRIRIAIDARLPESAVGGVQQVVCTLADGLSKVEDSDFDIFWIVYNNTTWWEPYIPKHHTVLRFRSPAGGVGLRLASILPSVVSRLMPIIRPLLRSHERSLETTLRSYGVKLVHIPYQDGVRTSLPTVYHPHDLQHKYFPEFFTKRQIVHRENEWKLRAEEASVVLVETDLVSADLNRFWQISKTKIQVLPTPPLHRGVGNFSVPINPQPYVFYPAAFWPHKNHMTLLRALKILHDGGLRVNVVLTGSTIGIFQQVLDLVRDLKIREFVEVHGHVDDQTFISILRGASVLVMPTLFESLSLPIWEAQQEGVPVICSNIGALPQQVGDSALLFDPLDPIQLAAQLECVLTDPKLRSTLISRGFERTEYLSSTTFAHAIFGVYRTVLGLPIRTIQQTSLDRLWSSVT